MNIEKPSRKKRLQEEKKLKEAVYNYRTEQRKKTIDRDSGMCVICFFVDKKIKNAVDVHHVYGRAPTKLVLNDNREKYGSLVCLCRMHHNQVDAIRKKDSAWSWMEDILNKANLTPINSEWKRETDGKSSNE